MHITIVDQIAPTRSATVQVPAGQNPVVIGSARGCHVVLPSLLAGGHFAKLENDGTGEGWRFWNLSGVEMEVTDYRRVDGDAQDITTGLWERDQSVPVSGPEVQVAWPYHRLDIRFDPTEMFDPRGAATRLDRAVAALVTEVHRSLVRLLNAPGVAAADKLAPDYILRLEQHVDELASRRPEFPGVAATETPLGNHCAGLAVRSELVRLLIAESGQTMPDLREGGERDAWAELRLREQVRETELAAQVAVARSALGLDTLPDLSNQMRRVHDRFWDYWRGALSGPEPPTFPLRRYLALRHVKKEIKDLWYGFGPLEDLLEDPTITEIMVVDKDHIFIEKDGEIEDSGRRFLDESNTEAIAQKIADRARRTLNDDMPLLDARMPDGSRVNAVHRSLALRGLSLTIRRFPRRRILMDDLVHQYRALSPSACDFLQAAVIDRRNIIVSGGTGSGKTTLLNCLSGCIPEKQRVVTIEDTSELVLQKAHVVTLQARRRTSQDGHEIGIAELVVNALRMRPDRIVVGECRRGEALAMLTAMNTGHDGSMTTLHANSPADVVLRLQTMCHMADAGLPVESIRRIISSAVDLVVQLGTITLEVESERGLEPRKFKVVEQIVEFTGLDDDGHLRIRPLFARRSDDPRLAPTGHLPTFLPDLIEAGLIEDPLTLVCNPIARE